MSRRVQENLVALILLGIFVAAIVASLGYSPRARLVPIPIAAIGILIIVGQMILQNLRSEDSLHIDLLEFLTKPAAEGNAVPEAAAPAAAASAPDSAAPRRSGRTPLSEIKALGVVVSLVVVFLLVGPIPAMFLFSAAYFIGSGYCSIPRGIAYAFFFTALVYIVFSLGLKVQLERNAFGIHYDTVVQQVEKIFQ